MEELNIQGYTISQFAEQMNKSDRYIRKLIAENKLPEGYKLKEISNKKRLIVKIEESNKKLYIHPDKFPAALKLQADTLYHELNGNIRQIAQELNLDYFCVYRYIKKLYKAKDDPRADKGKSRKFTPELIKVLKPLFERWYIANAQKNVALAIENVEKETGRKIPRRLADKWANSLKGVHTLKHNKKKFIAEHTPHIRRDLYGEYQNFLDCVVSDVWKIDDPYIPEAYREQINKELDELKKTNPNKYYMNRSKAATAYCLLFQDMKTRYPVSITICPHSVTGADVKKGMLRLITSYGMPKQWLLDNGHEFINDATIDFLMGIYFSDTELEGLKQKDKVIMLKAEDDEEKEATLVNSIPYHPQGKPIERSFRILKDEWAAYSESYSPNQFESRKPGLKLSSVQPDHNFTELAQSLDNFILNNFITRERKMFLNPGLADNHPLNLQRPKTIKEAFEMAYSVYNRKDADPFLLAFHYADRRQVTYRNGEISFVDQNSRLKLKYIPNEFETIMQYSGQKVTCLMDPQNIYHSWIFLGKELICEAQDLRFQEGIGLTKERATTIGKIQRKVVQLQKKRLEQIEELEILTPHSIVNTKTGEIIKDAELEEAEEIELEGFTLIKTKQAVKETEELDLSDFDDDLDDFIQPIKRS
jgi:transposase InsO family protein